jgi:Pro-kumamolisin, activation domain/Bacterial Ig-like domain (group 3)
MRLERTRLFWIGLSLSLLSSLTPAFAQTPAARSRITQAVDNDKRITRRGNVHPLARPEFDQGIAPDSLPANRMLLVLQRGPEQQAALDSLMEEQQVPSSSDYHKWLTPAEFGQMFGPSDADIATITNWLTSQGFQVDKVGAGRTAIEFSGTAGQVRTAFHTSLHKYVVNGKEHWANASDPQIPAALAPVVGGIVSLHNFRRKPMHRIREKSLLDPAYTMADGYGLGPTDFATIYNLLPLWNSGIDGTGQAIAIMGETDINVQDVRDFRAMFGLPAKDPEIIYNGPNPGITAYDELEADLDIQWSGAVAPNADIKFITSGYTDVASGIDLSSFYAVDNNVAPVISLSYGTCEQQLKAQHMPDGKTWSDFYHDLWQQAAAQGITVFVSSGDNGSAGCDDPGSKSATAGNAINGLGSTPFNVSVGGTDFDQVGNFATYWKSATNNDPATRASAISYIPEMTWNNSCAQNLNCTTSSLKTLVAASGGPSMLWTKPSWQSGVGVPNDGMRDTPDVSLFASNGFNGSYYIVCQADADNQCPGNPAEIGGTSAATPAFAGIMALINQYQAAHGGDSRQGNANFVFYNLAAQAGQSCDSSTAGPNSSCIFYDITKGNISVPCTAGTPNCTNGFLVDPNSTSTPAWTTTAHYDMATGLGSVNGNNLVTKWATASFTPTTTSITSINPSSITHGQSANVVINVAPKSGSGTPTGDVSLLANIGTAQNPVLVTVDRFTLSGGMVSGSTTSLPGGTYGVVAHYAGDGNFASSDSAPFTVTVTKETSKTVAGVITYNLYSQAITSYQASGAAYGSPYILEVSVGNSSMSSTKTSEGAPCASNLALCPTGTLTITDNGAPLDGGAFPLNGFGFADDQTIQLPPGTHNIAASYAGDNSFLPSSGATSITISKAVTSTGTPSPDNSTVSIAIPVHISAKISTMSNGAKPTGTVTFFNGGTPLSGIVTYTANDGSTTAASLTATLTISFSTSGTKAITAQYSGDTNYAASPISGSTTISVNGGTTPTTMPPPAFQPANPTVGSNVMFTATVNTTSSGVAPSGTVVFKVEGGANLGTVSVTGTNGGSGHNASAGATLSAWFPTAGTLTVDAIYSGDDTYQGSNSSTQITVTTPVTVGPDFTMPANWPNVTISAKGQSAPSTATLTSVQSFAGTVTVSCSVAPVLNEGPGCVGNSVQLSANGTATATVTVTTTAAHQTARLRNFGGALGGTLFACVLFAIPGHKRKLSTMLVLLLAILAAFGMITAMSACGGGSSSGGTTDSSTPSGNYTVTVTATASGASSSHQSTFTVTVP